MYSELLEVYGKYILIFSSGIEILPGCLESFVGYGP
jgi:hypothetical protein